MPTRSAMSRARASGSRATHRSTFAWFVRKTHVVEAEDIRLIWNVSRTTTSETRLVRRDSGVVSFARRRGWRRWSAFAARGREGGVMTDLNSRTSAPSPSHESEGGALAALTAAVLRHKRLVVAAWLLVTLAAFAAVGPAGNALSDEFSIPGREGFETNKQLAEIYGAGGDVAPIVPVVRLPAGTTVDSPGVRSDLDAALAEVEAAVPGSFSTSYGSTGDRAFVSDDGRTTFGLVYIPAKGGVDPGLKEARAAQAAVDGLTVGGAPVEVTGLDALRGSAGANDDGGAGLAIATLLAALGALLVLAFVFRSFMALVPLLMALVAIPTTFLLIWPLASVTDVSVIVQFLVALIGLGIAIDYALLVVARWREERRDAGLSNELAVRNAMQHAGSAVGFSGTTVAISLLALLALPVPFLRNIGVAGLLIALVSVAVAVTLLPVVLATVGPRLDRPRPRGEDGPS